MTVMTEERKRQIEEGRKLARQQEQQPVSTQPRQQLTARKTSKTPFRTGHEGRLQRHIKERDGVVIIDMHGKHIVGKLIETDRYTITIQMHAEGEPITLFKHAVKLFRPCTQNEQRQLEEGVVIHVDY